MKLSTTLLSILLLSTPLFTKENKIDDEQYRLMYDSFIFSKDLTHAYELAKKAIKSYPDSMYWHKKMGEIALWTNHSNEAMDNFTYVYKNTNDEKLADKIIKQLLATYQYKKALPIIKQKLNNNKNDDNVDKIEYIQDKIGRPEDTIKLLTKLYKKNPLPKYLTSMLSLYIETGEIDKAKPVVKKLQRHKKSSVKVAYLLAKYYFLQKKLKKAYKILLGVKPISKKDDVEYFKLLSDLGWYLHDYNNAVFGSLMVHRNKEARLVDYDRIEKVYLKKDIALMKTIAENAMKEHSSNKFFFSYANQAIKEKKYDQLSEFINKTLEDEKSSALIKKDARFWLIKAKVDHHFKSTNEVKEDLELALHYKPKHISNVTNTVLWSLIDTNQYDALDKMVNEIEINNTINPSLYHPLSAANLLLQKPDKAMAYLEKAEELKPMDLDLQFLKAEILAAQGQDKEKKELFKNILETLEKQKINKDKQYYRRYLQAFLELKPTKEFQQLLEKNKNNLTEKDYTELQLLLALNKKEYKKAKIFYKQLDEKNPTLDMEFASYKDERVKETSLMQESEKGLPAFQKIDFYEKNNNHKKAISTAKESIQNSKTNPYLKEKLNQLYKSYGNHFSIDIEHEKRGALKISTLELYNLYYIANGFSFSSKAKGYHHKSTDKEALRINKKDDFYLYAGVKKAIVHGSIELGVVYQNREEKEAGIVLKAEKKITDNILLKSYIETNMRVEDQSIYMAVGGKADTVQAEAIVELNQNQQLSFLAQYDKYYALDSTQVGDGKQVSIIYDYAFSHYPNFGSSIFYSYGNFEKEEKKGSIEKFLNKNHRADSLLQNDYSDAGVTLYYNKGEGDFDSKIHPYFDISAIYSSKESRMYSSVDGGINGYITKNNSYKLGAIYQNSFKGINQEEIKVYINFSHYY